MEFYYTAKSHDGSDILKGEQATVISIEKNNCMVVEKIITLDLEELQEIER
jgi:hypothetical protein